MKVIDLLNKIANKEKLPKKIRIRGIYYRDYNEETDEWIDKEDIIIWKLDNSYVYGDYYSEDGKQLFSNCYIVNRILNDEVEIIEPQEHKIPEKLNIDKEHNRLFKKDGSYWSIKAHQVYVYEVLNEILDYLEEIE